MATLTGVVSLVLVSFLLGEFNLLNYRTSDVTARRILIVITHTVQFRYGQMQILGKMLSLALYMGVFVILPTANYGCKLAISTRKRVCFLKCQCYLAADSRVLTQS